MKDDSERSQFTSEEEANPDLATRGTVEGDDQEKATAGIREDKTPDLESVNGSLEKTDWEQGRGKRETRAKGGGQCCTGKQTETGERAPEKEFGTKSWTYS